MRRLWRATAALAVGIQWLMIAGVATAADPNLGDLCSLMPSSSFIVQPFVGEPGGCQALVPGTDPNVSIAVAVAGPHEDPAGRLVSRREQAFDSTPQAAAYGEEGYEGFYLGGNDYAVMFRRGLYIAEIYGDTPDAAAMRNLAAEVDQKLLVAGAGGIPPTSAPTEPPASFGVGLACGVREDAGLRLLACTASPFGQAADTVLVYEWRLDGAVRPETGSTMQVDIVREGLAAGNHVIGVTARDTTNNLQATNSTSLDTTTAPFAVSVTCTYSQPQGFVDHLLSCAAAVSNPPPNADLSYTWTVNGAPEGVTDSETLTRKVEQGPVQVTVFARDSVSGQQTNAASYFLTINPTGTLTQMLTLGQTSDPQDVIDHLAGTAAVALVVAAGAAIAGALAGTAGALGGAGSVGVAGAASGATPSAGGAAAQPVPGPGAAATTESGFVGAEVAESVELVAQIIPEPWALPEPPPIDQPPPQAPVSPTAPPQAGSGPAGADSVGSQGSSGIPGAATPEQVENIRLAEEILTSTGESSSAPAAAPPTPDTSSSGPTPDEVGEGAADLLASEAGELPPLGDLEKWRALSGMPDTPDGNFALQSHLSQLAILQAGGNAPDPSEVLKALRDRAAVVRGEPGSDQ